MQYWGMTLMSLRSEESQTNERGFESSLVLVRGVSGDRSQVYKRISASKQSSFAPIDGGECTLHPVRADDNLNAFRIYPDEKVEIV